MSSRKLLMLILALAIAVGAIVLARQALKPKVDENGQVVEEHKGPQVLVAARDLAPGTFLKETDMKWQTWSEEPRENMIRKDHGGNKDDLNGSLLRHAVKMGEPLYDNRIFKTSEQGFLSAALSPGLRAISIKVTPVSGLAGLVFPRRPCRRHRRTQCASARSRRSATRSARKRDRGEQCSSAGT
jgi:pilus assembly protein CpaB